MTELIDVQMKETLKGIFPEYAAQFESAKSEEELIALHGEMVAECQEKLNSTIRLSGGDPGRLGAAKGEAPQILLTPKLQRALAGASQDKVKKEVLGVIKKLEKMKKLKKPTPEVLGDAFASAGIVVMASSKWVGVAAAISSSSSEAVPLGTALAAMISKGGAVAGGGATAATIPISAVVAAIAVVVAVLCVVYFVTAKSRKCVILFVNELDKPAKFEATHFDHGDKNSLSCSKSIPGSVYDPKNKIFPGAGFVIADKEALGFYGTQFGFSYKCGAHRLAVGTLCGLRNDNQCWCSIDESAKKVSSGLTKAKKLFHTVEKDNVKLTIHCNSHRNNPAFFIARAHFA